MSFYKGNQLIVGNGIIIGCVETTNEYYEEIISIVRSISRVVK